MVVDFADIKRALKTWIDDTLDHRMLLCKDDPVLPALRGELVYVMDENPTAENIAKLIFDHARSEGLPVTEVRLWETPTSYATYRA
jgi:6-pyruvoyltetrahydropterin/6-carboxytetrahydropterin synthase